jgi:ABC-type glycerol-3-phosphate transport system permease component
MSKRPPRPLAASRVARHLGLLLVLAFALLPIYWTVNTALKATGDIVVYPPSWVPPSPTTTHVLEVFTATAFPRQIFNSIVLALATIALVLVLGVHAGYVAARNDFRGKRAALLFLLTSIMIPGVVTLIPQYFLAVSLGLFDSRTALILIYAAWQLPIVVWIMKAFFEGIPIELDEAARVDGCSRVRAFYSIILPLSWPGLAASGIIVFVWVWNEFIIGLTLTQSETTRPLTAGLFSFVGETGIDWGRMTAGAAIALVPVIIFFLIFQRRFVDGLTAGATKG